MEALLDLDTFAKILTDKGYSGYFHTQGAYPGKLKESVSEYLESCQKGNESLPKGELLLTSYLQWSGEDSPRVQCNMWVKCLNDKFSINRMEVEKKDGFGQLLKKIDLIGRSIASVPRAVEAIALVSEGLMQKEEKSLKRFKL